MHAKMTIGDHVALWNGSLRHKMHTPAPPRVPCWSSAQVTLVYNGPLKQDKPLSVGAAQKTSCVPRGISTSPPLQPIHPREGKHGTEYTPRFSPCALCIRSVRDTHQGTSSHVSGIIGSTKAQVRIMRKNAQSPRAARRDRS